MLVVLVSGEHSVVRMMMMIRKGCKLSYLELYSFTPCTSADFDDFAGELDADGLGREHTPFVLDEAMQET